MSSAQPPPEPNATPAGAPDAPTQAVVGPPPPPPAGPPPEPSFAAPDQAKALFSQLDSTGYRPTAIVASIILALYFGSQLINAVIPVSAVGPGQPGPGGPGPVGPGPSSGPVGPRPGATPLPPGSTLTIGPLLVPLENGWVTQDVPESNVVVRLVKGGTAIDVFSATFQGQANAAAVYNAYLQTLEPAATGFGATQPNAIQIGAGIPAARGSYTGAFGQTQVEGEVTAFTLTGGEGWIFDVWSGTGTLRSALPEAQQMIHNLQVAQ